MLALGGVFEKVGIRWYPNSMCTVSVGVWDWGNLPYQTLYILDEVCSQNFHFLVIRQCVVCLTMDPTPCYLSMSIGIVYHNKIYFPLQNLTVQFLKRP